MKEYTKRKENYVASYDHVTRVSNIQSDCCIPAVFCLVD